MFAAPSRGASELRTVALSSLRLHTCHQAISHAPPPMSVAFTHAPIDRRDLIYETPTCRMVKVQELIHGPVEVICHVRDLLIEPVSRVRQDPPDEPPATSTANVELHEGHCTLARVCPSWLMRR